MLQAIVMMVLMTGSGRGGGEKHGKSRRRCNCDFLLKYTGKMIRTPRLTSSLWKSRQTGITMLSFGSLPILRCL